MKTALLAISAALIGAGQGLQSFANGEDAPEAAAPPAAASDTEAPKRGRGRPPGGSAAPAKSAEQAPEAPAEDDAAARFEANRALIKPLVDDSQGEDVKKVIAKYSKDGLKALPLEHQAAFEKDLAALSY